LSKPRDTQIADDETTGIISSETQSRSFWSFGKPRPMEELLRDSAFLFRVGQLTGATAMAAYLLQMKDDSEIKEIGERLGEMVAWYYTPPTPPRS
jgi:hypothetical protein